MAKPGNYDINDAARFFYDNLEKTGMVDRVGQSCRLRYKNAAFDDLSLRVDEGRGDAKLIHVCRHSEINNGKQPALCLEFDPKTREVVSIAHEEIVRIGDKVSFQEIKNQNSIGPIGREMIKALRNFNLGKQSAPSVVVEPNDEFKAVRLVDISRSSSRG